MNRVFVIALLSLLFTPFSAYAYIDPGTGSLIIQGLVALLAVAMVFFGQIKHKIKMMFSPEYKKRCEEANASTDEDEGK